MKRVVFFILVFVLSYNSQSEVRKVYSLSEVEIKYTPIVSSFSDRNCEILTKYRRARIELEESIADVVMTHPHLKIFMDEYLRRYFLVIKGHATIDYQTKRNEGKIGPSAIFKDLFITLRENYYLSSIIGCIDYPTKSMHGTGFTGTNPITIKNIPKKGNIREKIYQYYKGGRYLERIIGDKNLVGSINGWLKEKGENFQLRNDLIYSPEAPYTLGAYSAFRTRCSSSFEEANIWRKKNYKIKVSKSSQHLRIPLSEREKRIMQDITQKEDPSLIWIPGKAWFKPSLLKDCHNCPYATKYLTAVEENQLEQYSSISASADRMLTSAMFLDFTTKEDLYRARLATLSMIDALDHNAHEILFACKSFGLPFSFTPDFYKEIYPIDPQFTEKIRMAQKKRGFLMPDEYLSRK